MEREGRYLRKICNRVRNNIVCVQFALANLVESSRLQGGPTEETCASRGGIDNPTFARAFVQALIYRVFIYIPFYSIFMAL